MAKKSNRDIVNPPADKDAESNLLSSMILEPGEIGKVAQWVTEDDFFYPAHRTIFNAILALYTRPSMGDQKPIDSTTIWDELKHMGKHTNNETGAKDTDVSWSYLQHIAGLSPSITNITYYADLVLERKKDRKLLLISADIEKIANEPGETDEKIQRINQRVLQLDTPQADARVIPLGDSLVQLAHALHADLPGCVDSGFIELDQQTGGFYPGDLVVIGARTSMGKTSLALNIALNTALTGTGVLFISLEMAVSQLRSRALCMLAGLSLSEVRHNPDLDDAKKQTLLKAAKKYEKKSPPLFITNAGYTPEEQTMLLKQYRRRHNIGLVVIDYFQLMITNYRQQNLRYMATELSRAVKKIAQTENVPIILTSQLGPEQENSKNTYPQIADLREFGTVDQDADLIMLLFREDYYRRKDKSYGSVTTLEIDIAKHRNGPTGQVQLLFDKKKMMFQDAISVR